MTHDAGRPPGHAPERHAIGITRTCLASGTVQLPFALAGVLPEGELLVHDTEADEALVLWSEPPRRLAGLAPFFERHELQVNDSVVLEIRGDDLRLATAKRPRRARPAVRPSTWHSLHEDAPERAHQPDAVPDAEALDPAAHAEVVTDDDDAAATAAVAAHDTAASIGRAEAPPTHDAGTDRQDEPSDAIADDAPRAPRVAVRPLGDDDAGDSAPVGRPVRPSDATLVRPGPLARLGRFARSVFGGGRGDAARQDEDDARRRRERDWTRAWDEGEDDDLAPTEEFVDDVATPAQPTPHDRTPTDPPRVDAQEADAATTDEPPERRAPAEPAHDAPRMDAAMPVEPEPPLEDAAATTDEDVPPSPARADGAPQATPLFPDAVTGARPRRPSDETPSGVPARAERFLGGDLRTRLLRYLESPEMGSIAHAERIAKRFDLDVETAAEMLADIADEPPEGLRMRETRAGAWRIERTLRR